ncbi:MAG: DUF2807 domain-containing protein [Phaeodactylibacter sp.]|nr:DUF2807 domain-containing protein [Phaeodactylibacter sp.]
MTHPLRYFATLMAVMAILMLESCIVVDDESGSFFPCLEGEGPVETSKIELPPFTGIEDRSDVEVFLSQGPAQEVEARGHASLLDELILEVDGQDLEIRTRRCISDNSRIRLFITIPQLDRLVNSSAADIVGESTFLSENPEITLTGSGDVKLGVLAESVKANLSGSGSLLLEGESSSLSVKITGSGDFKGFGLTTLSTNVLISGSGDAEVFVEDYLEANISGSGDVFFKGSPFLETRLTGSGRVVDAN